MSKNGIERSLGRIEAGIDYIKERSDRHSKAIKEMNVRLGDGSEKIKGNRLLAEEAKTKADKNEKWINTVGYKIIGVVVGVGIVFQAIFHFGIKIIRFFRIK